MKCIVKNILLKLYVFNVKTIYQKVKFINLLEHNFFIKYFNSFRIINLIVYYRNNDKNNKMSNYEYGLELNYI